MIINLSNFNLLRLPYYYTDRDIYIYIYYYRPVFPLTHYASDGVSELVGPHLGALLAPPQILDLQQQDG